jgi:hypothetical protein
MTLEPGARARSTPSCCNVTCWFTRIVVAATACIGWHCSAVLACQVRLSADDETAAFQAAGFTRHGEEWRACDDPGTLSYVPGAIQEVRDLNGDGRPEAVITEGGTYCYGLAGAAFSVVSKRADGSWTLVVTSIGIPVFLPERGVDGWPDIEVGGPGFCFPVLRWDGHEYRVDRYQYAGVPCERD